MSENNQQPAGDANPSTEPTAPQAQVPEGYVSQDEINRIVQGRVERARVSEQNKFNSQLESMGFAGGIEGLTSFVNTQKEKDQEKERLYRESLANSNKHKELAELDRQNYDKALAEKDARIEEANLALLKVKQDHADQRLNTLIRDAAKNAVDPADVATLLRNRIKQDPDNGKVYAVDEYGVQIMDGSGNPLPLDKYVDNFLESKPHYRKPLAGNGTVSQNSNNSAPSSFNAEFDVQKAINDPEYREKHKDKILDLVRKGA